MNNRELNVLLFSFDHILNCVHCRRGCRNNISNLDCLSFLPNKGICRKLKCDKRIDSCDVARNCVLNEGFLMKRTKGWIPE